jgi:hypothetical protein
MKYGFTRNLNRAIADRHAVCGVGLMLIAVICFLPFAMMAFAIAGLPVVGGAGGGGLLCNAMLTGLSTNPTLRNFAIDASQNAIRPVANFLAPRVEVPDVTGFYKTYNAEHRYKRPKTLRSPGGKATRIGFDADDTAYVLKAHALDFPIPNVDGMSQESAMHHAQYGTLLLADSAALDHEAEVVTAAKAAAGAGTDKDFTSSSVDPIAEINAKILAVMKAAKNGAPVKVLFGATALLRTTENANVRGRLVGGKGGASKGASIAIPTLEDLSRMLFGNPKCEVALFVEDTAADGLAESISFLLDTEILIFASNDSPNTLDPSFMKTLVPMGGFMKPGTYRTEDERDDVLKMDWTTKVVVTNSAAVGRVNANNS